MEKEAKKLLEHFKTINQKGWIEGLNKSTSSVGLTFESEIRKKYDTDMFPDFYGIEIKCTQRYSNYPITLFSKVFDGPRLYEMNYIYLNYIEEHITTKYNYIHLRSNRKTLFKNIYFFELKIDKENKRILLNIYNMDDKLIDTSYIEFEHILKHLEIKFSKLALISASKKEENDINYYRYYKIGYYKLKSIDKFISLLESGIINVLLIAKKRDSNDSARTLTHNRKVQFQIDKDKIEFLFEKIFEYNADVNSLYVNTKYIEKEAKDFLTNP